MFSFRPITVKGSAPCPFPAISRRRAVRYVLPPSNHREGQCSMSFSHDITEEGGALCSPSVLSL